MVEPSYNRPCGVDQRTLDSGASGFVELHLCGRSLPGVGSRNAERAPVRFLHAPRESLRCQGTIPHGLSKFGRTLLRAESPARQTTCSTMEGRHCDPEKSHRKSSG